MPRLKSSHFPFPSFTLSLSLPFPIHLGSESQAEPVHHTASVAFLAQSLVKVLNSALVTAEFKSIFVYVVGGLA